MVIHSSCSFVDQKPLPSGIYQPVYTKRGQLSIRFLSWLRYRFFFLLRMCRAASRFQVSFFYLRYRSISEMLIAAGVRGVRLEMHFFLPVFSDIVSSHCHSLFQGLATSSL